MRLSDEALDEAILAADPLDGTEFGSVAPGDRAREAHSRIVSTRPGGRSAMPRAGRLLVAVGAVLTIGAVLGALIIAVPSDPAAPPSGAPGGPATSPNTLPSTPRPPVGPGEPAVDPRPAAPGRGAAVATPPAGAHSGSGIALLEQRGLARTEIPVELLRGDYCQIYADRVHRIAEIPSGGAVYLAWGPDDQVTWVKLGTGSGDGGGCSSASEVRDRQVIVLAPEVGPTITPSGPDATPIRPDPPRYFVGFARDGYTSAVADGVTVPIRENVFVLETARPQKTLRLTVRGPAGVHRVTMSYAVP